MPSGTTITACATALVRPNDPTPPWATTPPSCRTVAPRASVPTADVVTTDVQLRGIDGVSGPMLVVLVTPDSCTDAVLAGDTDPIAGVAVTPDSAIVTVGVLNVATVPVAMTFVPSSVMPLRSTPTVPTAVVVLTPVSAAWAGTLGPTVPTAAGLVTVVRPRADDGLVTPTADVVTTPDGVTLK